MAFNALAQPTQPSSETSSQQPTPQAQNGTSWIWLLAGGVVVIALVLGGAYYLLRSRKP
jgi:LPXTG-motif cell wall-anchored protein